MHDIDNPACIMDATGENVKSTEETLYEAIAARDKEDAEKKQIEECKRKNEKFPLENVDELGDNDVMCGRGAGTNIHPGNIMFRRMVEARKVDYNITSDRLHKPLIALEIIKSVRGQNPPGRFLEQSKTTGKWNDVGDDRARKKTIQALREKAPEIRKKHRETVANGTKKANETKTSKPKKPSLVRGRTLEWLHQTISPMEERGGVELHPPADGHGHTENSEVNTGSKLKKPFFVRGRTVERFVQTFFPKNDAALHPPADSHGHVGNNEGNTDKPKKSFFEGGRPWNDLSRVSSQERKATTLESPPLVDSHENLTNDEVRMGNPKKPFLERGQTWELIVQTFLPKKKRYNAELPPPVSTRNTQSDSSLWIGDSQQLPRTPGQRHNSDSALWIGSPIGSTIGNQAYSPSVTGWCNRGGTQSERNKSLLDPLPIAAAGWPNRETQSERIAPITKRPSHDHGTTPSMKKAALNRDFSETTNRLKKQYMPELFYTQMKSLLLDGGSDSERSNGSFLPGVDRRSSSDRPAPINSDNRRNTIEEFEFGQLREYECS